MRIGAGVALTLLAGIGSFYGYLRLTDNLGVVVAGEVYRSAQPGESDLVSDVRKLGIRSVINLRGENTGTGWYDKEIATSRQLGIRHFDFRMSAREELTAPRAQELIALMAKAEKPLLIHCEGGADRSGLASALYLAAIAKASEPQAEKQISLAYGHISLRLNSAYAMDRTFERLEPTLGFHNS